MNALLQQILTHFIYIRHKCVEQLCFMVTFSEDGRTEHSPWIWRFLKSSFSCCHCCGHHGIGHWNVLLWFKATEPSAWYIAQKASTIVSSLLLDMFVKKFLVTIAGSKWQILKIFWSAVTSYRQLNISVRATALYNKFIFLWANC